MKMDADTLDRVKKPLRCVHCVFYQVMHALKCNLLHNIYQHVTWEPLDGKTWFQAHIVEHLKSYPMVVETWELVQGNQNMPLFARGTFSKRCG